MRIDRLRHEDLEGVVDRLGDNGCEGTPALLVQITSGGSYPRIANSYYLAYIVTVGGAEIEGGPGSFYVDLNQIVVVYNAGTMIPTAGGNFLAHLVGGRWVIDFNG